jgi:hypothetical protein
MAATLSSSPRDRSSPLEPLRFARSVVEDYARNELAPDQTSKILFAFLDHLPPDGLCNVREDVIKAQQDPDGLRDLADYYVSHILLPSMFSPAF